MQKEEKRGPTMLREYGGKRGRSETRRMGVENPEALRRRLIPKTVWTLEKIHRI